MVRAESLTATLRYTYTVDGLRVAQDVDGAVTTFAWDWALPLAQVMATSDGVLSLYGLGHLGETRSGDWAYPLVDALDSVRQWSDGDGAVTYAAGYTPFGEAQWHAGSTASSWGYAGEWYDPHADLLYLRARWYAVQTSRFTTQDPWGGDHQRPGTLNPYVYGLNNPVLYTDPSGKWCIAGFDVGPGRGCTNDQRERWVAAWERAAGLASSPDFAEGFLLEFVDSVLAGGISISSSAWEHWLEQPKSQSLQQFFVQLMILRCSSGPESYAALRTPYSYLFKRPDPRFQLGRAVGRVTALGLALGEISVSVTGGAASVAIAGTGVGVPVGVGGAALSVEIGAHAAAVIGTVVAKEATDHLVMSVVAGNLPGASGSNQPSVPGTWGPRRGTGGAEYERVVREHLGGPPDKNLYHDGVAYDAWNPNTQSFVDAKDAPGNWYTDDLSPGAVEVRNADILREARRQIDHAGQYKVEWWTNNPEAESFLKRFFELHGIPIDVKKWP